MQFRVLIILVMLQCFCSAAADSANSAVCSHPYQSARIVEQLQPEYASHPGFVLISTPAPQLFDKPGITVVVAMPTVLRVRIDAAGRVTKIDLFKSSGHHVLDAQAKFVAQQSTYSPALRHCRRIPSAVWFTQRWDGY